MESTDEWSKAQTRIPFSRNPPAAHGVEAGARIVEASIAGASPRDLRFAPVARVLPRRARGVGIRGTFPFGEGDGAEEGKGSSRTPKSREQGNDQVGVLRGHISSVGVQPAGVHREGCQAGTVVLR